MPAGRGPGTNCKRKKTCVANVESLRSIAQIETVEVYPKRVIITVLKFLYRGKA